LAAKSLIDDVAAVVVDVAHMARGQLEEAWEEGTVVAAARNTSVDSAVIAKPAVHTFCVGHVRKERLQKLENSTGEYDTKSGDKVVATFVRLP
jgi:hypothetical protein